MRYGVVLLGSLVICSLATGCGKSKGTVSGKVTYQGKPLTSGLVTFVPEKGAAVYSPIDAEGKYRVENVPLGLAKISVGEGNAGNQEAPPKPRNPGGMTEFMVPKNKGLNIPAKFKDPEASGITHQVEQGTRERDIDLK
jgi:hypothetical protein